MTQPSVLVGCEYSATVRDEFLKTGHDAWSCDLKPCDKGNDRHIQHDVRLAIRSRRWSLIILHVDCTAMTVAGNRHYGVGTAGYAKRIAAIAWTCGAVEDALQHSDCVALENPASVIFPILRAVYGADVQYVHPWQHGHPEQKKTGFALWGLPRLRETDNVYDHMMTLPKRERERIFHMPPSANRGHERSRFYTGIAAAMADQWGQAIA